MYTPLKVSLKTLTNISVLKVEMNGLKWQKKKREELNDTEWNHWVNDFIP